MCKSWMSFADQSTTHGLGQLGRENKHILTRLFFAIVVLVCGITCAYMMTIQINQYLSFDLKTTTSLSQFNTLTFPAVTFVNENTFRKSVVGGSLQFLEDILTYYVSDNASIEEYQVNYLSYCYDSKNSNNLTSVLDDGIVFWNNLGIGGVMSLTSMDSYQSVLECSWLNKIVKNCTAANLFLNHESDYGWSFTFNPSDNIVNSLSSQMAYGIAAGANQVRSIVNSGPKNGLRLILNALQDDYCFTKDKGAGFRVIVHDPDVQPLFFLEDAILLSPGFDVSIAIQATQIIRETESLGKCKSFVPLRLYPNATVYFKQACYMACFSDYVVSQCDCFPVFGPLTGYEVYYKPLNITICFGIPMVCMNNAIATFTGNGSLMSTMCSQCVDPCEEVSYSHSVSFQYFPAATQAIALQKYNITNLTAARYNLLGVNIFVQSLQITTITESQDYTLTDLVGALGGLFGLFLGMSIVSITEIVHQLLLSAKIAGNRLVANRRARRNAQQR